MVDVIYIFISYVLLYIMFLKNCIAIRYVYRNIIIIKQKNPLCYMLQLSTIVETFVLSCCKSVIYMHLRLLQSWWTVRCDRRFLNTRRILDEKVIVSNSCVKDSLLVQICKQINHAMLVKAAALMRTGTCPNICCQQLKLHSTL